MSAEPIRKKDGPDVHSCCGRAREGKPRYRLTRDGYVERCPHCEPLLSKDNGK